MLKISQLPFVASIFILISISGCGTTLAKNQVRLTVRSQPEGAMIYQGSLALGPAPQALIYTGDLQEGRIKTAEIKVVWPSGATRSFWTMLYMGQGDRAVTVSRPPEIAGMDKDLEFANQLRLVEAQKRAAEAREAAAYQERAAALARQEAAQAESARAKKPIFLDCNLSGRNIDCFGF